MLEIKNYGNNSFDSPSSDSVELNNVYNIENFRPKSELDDLFDSLTYLCKKNNQLFCFMKIDGYFDASGTHEDQDKQGNYSPAIVVAGFLADRDKWTAFDRKWRLLLDRFRLESFHMTDFVAKEGEFKGWSKPKSDDFMGQAMPIITNAGLYGVGMTVRRDDYIHAVSQHKLIEKILGEPATFCALRCWESSADWARQNNYDEVIKYIFEGGETGNHEILEAHNQMCKDSDTKKLYRFGVGSLTFASKKCTPLHAADLLAFIMYKEEYRLKYTPNNEQRVSWASLLQNGTFKYYVGSDLKGYVLDAIEKIQEKEKLAA